MVAEGGEVHGDEAALLIGQVQRDAGDLLGMGIGAEDERAVAVTHDDAAVVEEAGRRRAAFAGEELDAFDVLAFVGGDEHDIVDRAGEEGGGLDGLAPQFALGAHFCAGSGHGTAAQCADTLLALAGFRADF